MDSINSSSLIPPPSLRHTFPRNIVNAGNTCYLDAVIVAMFAEFDGWDALLKTDKKPIANVLRPFVNLLRLGDRVPKQQVQTTREALINHANWYKGSAQQDAAELFAILLDNLHAPFVPLVRNLIHGARADPSDHTPFTERLLWLRSPSRSDSLHAMIQDYFLAGTLQVSRGREAASSNSLVPAQVSISLIPAYTAERETGERVSASRLMFDTLVVPFAVRRFRPDNMRKNTNHVQIPTAISAVDYVEPFARGMNHILILRSVVCHLGSTIKSGHYVTYTHSSKDGWRRWDDLSSDAVISVAGNVKTGEPSNRRWAKEIAENCYLLFYELVPGDDYNSSLKGGKLRQKVYTKGDELLANEIQFKEFEGDSNHVPFPSYHPSQESLDGEMAIQLQIKEINAEEDARRRER